MKRYFLVTIVFLFVISLQAQTIDVFRNLENQKPTKQSFIYSLPQTSVTVVVEVTKTSIAKGPYAAYAKKYLKLENVVMKDTSFWDITDVKVTNSVEADPSQMYMVTFKTFPDQVRRLFSLSNNGIVLNFGNVADEAYKSSGFAHNLYFDPLITEELDKEKIDTLYKTVMTDSTIVKIPIFKKQIQAKSNEELIEEAAHELIKTRKRKLKTLRGEYDYHPDGKALEVMVTELSKYEEQLLEMFTGKHSTEKQYFTYTIVPKATELTKELSYFSGAKGIQNEKAFKSSALSVQFVRNQEPLQSVTPEKNKGLLYFRAPIATTVTVKLDDKNLYSIRIPVYQFGPILTMPLN